MELGINISGIPAHWARLPALAAFHGLIQRIAVGNIDECTAAAEVGSGTSRYLLNRHPVSGGGASIPSLYA
jgi:hypothetical protein